MNLLLFPKTVILGLILNRIAVWIITIDNKKEGGLNQRVPPSFVIRMNLWFCF